jgi:hypothetical protein
LNESESVEIITVNKAASKRYLDPLALAQKKKGSSKGAFIQTSRNSWGQLKLYYMIAQFPSGQALAMVALLLRYGYPSQLQNRSRDTEHMQTWA